MKLDRLTPFHYFEIWEPVYSKKAVLLACHKVGTHNKVVFTKAPSMGEEPYYVSGKDVRKCKKESNGRINCYIVPLDKLQPLELSVNSEFEL